MGGKNTFLKLVNQKDNQIIIDAQYRLENKDWLRKSQEISLMILKILSEKNLTKQQLAYKTGLSQPTITQLLKGKTKYTHTNLGRIEKALGVSLTHML